MLLSEYLGVQPSPILALQDPASVFISGTYLCSSETRAAERCCSGMGESGTTVLYHSKEMCKATSLAECEDYKDA